MDIDGIIRGILIAVRDLPSPLNYLIIYGSSLLMAIALWIVALNLLSKSSSVLRMIEFDIKAAQDSRRHRQRMVERHRPRRSPRQPRQKRSPYLPPVTSQSIPQQQLQRRLLDLLHGDTAAASRLIEGQKLKNPGMAQQWYLEKVLWDLERDRGRGYYL